MRTSVPVLRATSGEPGMVVADLDGRRGTARAGTLGPGPTTPVGAAHSIVPSHTPVR